MAAIEEVKVRGVVGHPCSPLGCVYLTHPAAVSFLVPCCLRAWGGLRTETMRTSVGDVLYCSSVVVQADPASAFLGSYYTQQQSRGPAPPPRLPAARTTGTRFTDSCHVCCPLSFQVAEEVTGVDDGETAANTVQVTELMAKLKATSGTEASTAIAKELVDMVQALGIQVWTDPMNVLSLRPRIGILSLLLRFVLSASPRSPSAARDLRPTYHTRLQRHHFRSSLFAVARRRS